MQTLRAFFLIYWIFPVSALGQKPMNYMKNDHVEMKTNIQKGYYHIKFTFKDPWENSRTITLEYAKNPTDKEIRRFGIPQWMFDPFPVTPEELEKRERILNEGMFKEEGNKYIIDRKVLIEYYRSQCKPVADYITGMLKQEKNDTRKNRIEFAMKFVQDIPYGVPEERGKEMYYGGVFSPPELLIRNYGDCDSKALLFVSIMSYLVDPNDIIFLQQPNHLLTAIKGSPQKTDASIRYKGAVYILAETAGPGRVAWGETGRFYRKNTKFIIEKLNF